MKPKETRLTLLYVTVALLTWGHNYNRIQQEPQKPVWDEKREHIEVYEQRWQHWKMEMRDYSDTAEEQKVYAAMRGTFWPAYLAIKATLWITKP